MSADTEPRMSIPAGLYDNFSDDNFPPESDLFKVYQTYLREIGAHTSDVIYARQVLPEKLKDVSYGLPSLEALKSLENGWDGYDSPRPSDRVIERAGDVWDFMTGLVGPRIARPRVTPSSAGNVAFSWRRGEIELELWIRDEDEFSADWCVACPGEPYKSGETTQIDGVESAIKQFLSGA